MSSGRSGNLVKSFYLAREGVEPRVIDSNSIIEEKLENLRYSFPEPAKNALDFTEQDYSQEPEFSEGLDADTLNALVGDPDEAMEYTAEFDEEGNPVSNVIKANPYEPEPEPYVEPEPVYQGPTREEIEEMARAEIEAMKAEAAGEIERRKTVGYEEGKAQGYEEGRAQAEAEIAQEREAIEREREGLQSQFEEMMDELEPRFVHTLTSIYEKIFEVDLSGHKDLILGLLRNAMGHIESSKTYMIHVSREDYAFVTENKGRLAMDSLAEDATIDIIEDATLKANECMIETPGGIFDCSLGTELELLRKKLELLSYTP
ncbi:MAG: hypothetical protein K5868_09395 [Lachnospiraceae bacterium]|nr:hypothetical protein [Lachnospiraceae bacterium]